MPKGRVFFHLVHLLQAERLVCLFPFVICLTVNNYLKEKKPRALNYFLVLVNVDDSDTKIYRTRLEIEPIKENFEGKILVNPKTGDEISFITIGMHKYMLDAKEFISKGRKLSEMSQDEKQSLLGLKVEGEWNEEKQEFTNNTDCGTTLAEFLDKKANKIK